MVQSKTKARLKSTLTLTGEGQARVKPDIARINLGVVSTAKIAEEAVRDNAALMSRVVAKMKALGIQGEDLQTVGLSISPVVDYEENSPTYGQVVSYTVEDTLRVTSSIEKAARVLDQGVAAGANTAGGLSFGVRNDAKYRKRALKAAVLAARADADIVAAAMKISVRRVESAEVTSGGNPIVMHSAMRKSEATPIEPGVLTISASVRVVYELRATRRRKAS